MTPQERLKLKRQHQREVAEAVGGHDPEIDNSWPKVYKLWLKYYAALLEAEWSAAIDRGLPPREVHAHLVKRKRDLLRLTEWSDLMPLGWKHCWFLRPKEMPALWKYLNRHLTADISHLCAQIKADLIQPAQSDAAVVSHAASAENTTGTTPSDHTQALRQDLQPRPRLRQSVCSPLAVTRIESHLTSTGMSLTDFANSVGTSDRTLRRFRQTRKIRRDIFVQIAKRLGTTPEELLKPLE
ncbi:MAG: helix-turn-helix domain-containing protein [Bryobacteraceae bacterium]